MKDELKTKEQLINELVEMRQRIAELEASETKRKWAEEALREKEAHLQAVFEAAGNISFVTMDLTGTEPRILDFSPGAERIFGYSRKEVIGKPVAMLHLPEDMARFSEVLEAMRQRKSGFTGESTLVRKSGEEFPTLFTTYPIFDAEGNMAAILSVSIDITERKQAEEALRESEERYRAIFEQAADSIVLIDTETGALVDFNDRAHENLGYTREEFQKLKIPDFEIIESAEEVTKHIEKTIKEGADTFETKHRTKGGKARDTLVSSRAISIGGRDFVQSMWSDITERKRAEEALRESEERYRTLFEQANDAIFLNNIDDKITDVNRRACEMLGYTREELLSMKVPDLQAPEVRRQEGSVIKEELRYGDAPFETIDIHRDGRRIPVEVSTTWVAGKGDGLVLSIVRDITERKRAEEALAEERNLLRTIIDNLPDYIYVKDTESRYFVSNMAHVRFLGATTPDEVIGKSVVELYPQDLAAQYYADDQGVMRSGQPLLKREERSVDQAGNDVWLLTTKVPLRDSDGKIVGLVGIARDITKRKRAEEALRRRNRELALLNRAGQAFSSTLDLDQVLVTVLEETRRLLDVVACSAWLIEPKTEELVCRQAVGPQSEVVRGWRLAPGEGLAGWVTRSGESLIVPDTRADERHFKDVDRQTGLALRSILSVPLRVKEDVIGVIQVVDTEVGRFSPADLTLLEPLATAAAVALENARLYEQARQDAETRAVLLREVNHRVQNNLTAIIGFLYAARRRAELEDQAVYQSIMQDLVNRVQGLSTVHSLFSASGWAPLLLSEVATQVVESSLRMLPRDKRVSVEASPSPVRVTPDQAHNLALVVNELATNTVKHTLWERNTAHITVRITLEDDTVLFEYRDDGPGYPEEALQLERHTTGLDLIQNIVRKSLRGELSLHNDHGAVAVIQFKAKA